MFEAVVRKLNRLASLLQSKGYREEALLIAQMLDPKLAPDVRVLEIWWRDNPDASINDVMNKWQKENREKGQDRDAFIGVWKALEDIQTDIEQQKEDIKKRDIEIKEAPQKEEQEYLKWGTATAEQIGRLRNQKKMVEEYLKKKDRRIFPPGALQRIRAAYERGGKTIPFWGENDPVGVPHILAAHNIIDEIEKDNMGVFPVDTWNKKKKKEGEEEENLAYVAMEYDDRGVPSMVLYNIAPMTISTKIKPGDKKAEKGVGNRTFVVPQYIDNYYWADVLEELSKDQLAEIIFEKKKQNNGVFEPGWQAYNRGPLSNQLLQKVLRYSKGESNA